MLLLQGKEVLPGIEDPIGVPSQFSRFILEDFFNDKVTLLYSLLFHRASDTSTAPTFTASSR